MGGEARQVALQTGDSVHPWKDLDVGFVFIVQKCCFFFFFFGLFGFFRAAPMRMVVPRLGI